MANIKSAVEYLQEITNQTITADEFSDLKQQVEDRKFTREELEKLKDAITMHKDALAQNGVGEDAVNKLAAALATPHLYQSEGFVDSVKKADTSGTPMEAVQSAGREAVDYLQETKESLDSIADRVIPIQDDLEIPWIGEVKGAGKLARRGIAYAVAGAAFYYLLYKPAQWLLKKFPLIGNKKDNFFKRNLRRVLGWTGVLWAADQIVRRGDRWLREKALKDTKLTTNPKPEGETEEQERARLSNEDLLDGEDLEDKDGKKIRVAVQRPTGIVVQPEGGTAQMWALRGFGPAAVASFDIKEAKRMNDGGLELLIHGKALITVPFTEKVLVDVDVENRQVLKPEQVQELLEHLTTAAQRHAYTFTVPVKQQDGTEKEYTVGLKPL